MHNLRTVNVDQRGKQGKKNKENVKESYCLYSFIVVYVFANIKLHLVL